MTVMLYKRPGDEHLPQHGGNFSLVIVTEGEVSGFLANGWHRTPQAALDAHKPEPEPAVIDLPEPDRSQIEAEPEPEQPKRRGRPRKVKTDVD